MKRIGLLGGMSWESSAEYYRLVNEATRDRLGGLHSADCVLRSVDFAGIEALPREGRWDEASAVLAALADRGAEGILLGCTEIDLLIGPQDAPVPVFDTTALHASRAVELSLTET